MALEIVIEPRLLMVGTYLRIRAVLGSMHAVQVDREEGAGDPGVLHARVGHHS